MSTEITKTATKSESPQHGVRKSRFTLSNIKDTLGAAQALATIVAIGLGGWWFIDQRSTKPRLKIEHEISNVQLDTEHVLLAVDVKVTNISKVLIPKLCGRTQPLLVKPLTDGIEKQLSQLKTGDDPTSGRRNFDWDGIAPPKCLGSDVCEANKELSCSSDSDLIEPDETDTVHYEFVIPSGVEIVAVYSYFKNTKQPATDVGWQMTTLYPVKPAP